MMRRVNRELIMIISVCLLSPWLQGQNATYRAFEDLNSIAPPDLEKELASFSLLDGFDISLYAATPMIEKPVQMNFDSDGRLWVCGSHIYPQLNVNQEPSDQVIILEDTDNDGVADKSSIFYDKLIIPGGVLPDNRGGAYVANGDKLIHLSDTDSDGKADKSEVLLSGFGTEDTHHTLHRLGWGPGGKMYLLQGYYISSHVETAYGPRHLNGGGLWTYDVDTRRLEIFTKGYINPWGHSVSYWGQSFESDGAGTGFGHSFPNSVFRASPGESHSLPALTPKSPKASGIEIISGKHFPSSWTGNIITNDFRANITDRYTLEANGSSYIAELQPTFLKSSHKSFRPVDLAMGPDGALYIADWYSPVIQHGEVDFRDERRDHQHGRIWRITAKGRPLLRKPDYKGSSIPELLDLLKAEENWVRLLAKQTLKAREPKQVMSAIDDWVKALDPQDPNYEHHRLEALWTVQTLNLIDPDLLKSVMKSKTAGARSAAARVLYYWNENVPDALDLLKEAVQDSDASVRREAITTLSQFSSTEAFNIALIAYNSNMDASYSFALRQTCRMLSEYWITSLLENAISPNTDGSALIFALKSTEDPRAAQPLIDLFKKSKNPDPDILPVLGRLANPEQLNFLTEIVSSPGKQNTTMAAKGLLIAANDRSVFPGENKTDALQKLFLSTKDDDLAIACALTGHWKIEEFINQLKQNLSKENVSHSVNRSAADALAMIGTNDIRDFLQQTIDKDISVNTTKHAVYALVKVDLDQGIEAIANTLTKEIDEQFTQNLLRQIIRRDGAFRALSRALEGKAMPSQTAMYAIRYVQVSDREGAEVLMAALANAGNVEIKSNDSNYQQNTAGLLAKLKNGDAKKGKTVYLRPELACISCHKIKGEGLTDIGPDLGSIGASAPADYIIESLLEPSKKIKEGYKSSSIITEDGGYYQGSISFEDANRLTIKTATGSEVSIQKSKIKSREVSKMSMMPTGLVEALPEEEFIDLLKYLTELGKARN